MGWSEQARKAALEARRRKMKAKPPQDSWKVGYTKRWQKNHALALKGLSKQKVTLLSRTQRIAHLTDINYHGQAMVLGAKASHQTNIARKISLINKLHNKKGHLTPKLNKTRYNLYSRMMKGAKKNMTSNNFKEFYRAF